MAKNRKKNVNNQINSNNQEGKNMENENANVTNNAAPAAEEVKKGGLFKKILKIVGIPAVIIALILGAFGIGRATGSKSEEDDEYDEDEA